MPLLTIHCEAVVFADLYPVPKLYVAMYSYNALHDEQLSLTPNDVILASSSIPINGWVKGCKRDHPDKVSQCPSPSCPRQLFACLDVVFIR